MVTDLVIYYKDILRTNVLPPTTISSSVVVIQLHDTTIPYIHSLTQLANILIEIEKKGFTKKHLKNASAHECPVPAL